MLVLTRREGESLIIGDATHLKVLMIKGKQVRIGIVAPPEVAVKRDEQFGDEPMGNADAGFPNLKN